MREQGPLKCVGDSFLLSTETIEAVIRAPMVVATCSASRRLLTNCSAAMANAIVRRSPLTRKNQGSCPPKAPPSWVLGAVTRVMDVVPKGIVNRAVSPRSGS